VTATTRAHTRVDDLVRGARRWTMRSVLIHRLFSSIGPLSWVWMNYPSGVTAPVFAVAAVVLAANGVVLVQLLNPTGEHPYARRLLLADVVVAVGVNLWSAGALPGSVNEPYHDVFFFLFLGTVGMWTLYAGPRAGATVLALTIPVQMTMSLLDGAGLAGHWYVIGSRSVWLAVALLSAYLVVLIIRRLAAVAHEEGERAGRQEAQIQNLRSLHDTVLQTLEGIGMLASNRRLDSEDRIAVMGTSARRQAAELRASLRELLDESAEPAPEPASTELRTAIEEASTRPATLGLRVDVRGDPVELPARTAEAMRLGVQEALSNVVRHAGTDRATVRVVAGTDLVQVLVRDRGRGFDPEDPALERGFGVAHSIVGRLSDVGGGATIRSRPGAGTVVRMWVPRAVPVRGARRPARDDATPAGRR
jgi:signal transduction histidine kinase